MDREMDHAAIQRHVKDHAHERVRHILGHAHGGRSDAETDKALVRSAIRQHEMHDHKGVPLTKLKLRDGGMAEGHKGRRRLDRGTRRRDAGGAVAGDAANNGAGSNSPALSNAINAGLAKMLTQNQSGSNAGPSQTPTPDNRGGRTKKRAAGGKVATDAPWPDNMNVKRGGRAPARRADGGRMNGPTAREDGSGETFEEMVRMDERQNYADGGRSKHRGASHVNVIVATPGQNRPVPVPVPVGGAGAPPPRPPMAPPPGAGMPPGGVPMRPGMPPGASGMMPPGAGGMPMMRADGGRTKEGRDARGPDPIERVREKNERMYSEVRADGGRMAPKMWAGAKSGEGRMEKAKSYGKPESALAAGD